ncbi:MAG: hypothetical protein NTV34_14650 [Proteobacteria bacterium]|nr:hypothetical protein [Pseudomonadota bacterium]
MREVRDVDWPKYLSSDNDPLLEYWRWQVNLDVYMCRWTETIIADENCIYDPSDSSDRMILGIRGQMSEMELENSIGRNDEGRG